MPPHGPRRRRAAATEQRRESARGVGTPSLSPPAAATGEPGPMTRMPLLLGCVAPDGALPQVDHRQQR